MSLKSDLMDFVYDETIKMLSGTTNAPVSGAQNILPLYQPEGAGGIKDVHSDVVFYKITPIDNQYNRQLDTTTNGDTDPALTLVMTKYNRPMRITWECCGDDSLEWSDTLRTMLFDPFINQDFEANGMSLIADVPSPIFVPESIGQQWLDRYDLRADFNQLVIKQTTIPAIALADIIIESERGVEATCSVSPA